MEVPDHVVPPAASSHRPAGARFQFGLRAMLIAMTISAVLLSAVFGGPSWVTALTVTILIVLAPMCLTIGLVYGRGYLQTFCIGGMFPATAILSWICPFTVTSFNPMDWPGLWTNLGIGTGIALGAVVITAFGFTACALRWLIEQSARPADDDTPF